MKTESDTRTEYLRWKFRNNEKVRRGRSALLTWVMLLTWVSAVDLGYAVWVSAVDLGYAVNLGQCC